MLADRLKTLAPSSTLAVQAKARELRRRGVDYEEVRVAWRQRDRPEIEKLSGQRHVPLLVIEKEAICDSLRIIEHLEWRSEQS